MPSTPLASTVQPRALSATATLFAPAARVDTFCIRTTVLMIRLFARSMVIILVDKFAMPVCNLVLLAGSRLATARPVSRGICFLHPISVLLNALRATIGLITSVRHVQLNAKHVLL